MTEFFIPPHTHGDPAAEQTYRKLRDQAEACTGETSSERRIEGLLCRRGGRDCHLRVGELDTANGQTVSAIIKLGRATYTVHHLSAGPSRQLEPTVLHQDTIYAVTSFH